MGVRGTDVAKEAASIVLQDDRFETIAAAVEEGRVIADNLRKFVFYLPSLRTREAVRALGPRAPTTARFSAGKFPECAGRIPTVLEHSILFEAAHKAIRAVLNGYGSCRSGCWSSEEPTMQNHPDSFSRTGCTSREDLDLRTRIRAEFGEMPGLKLTLPQAARLFHLERARCERVLGALVDGGALSSDGKAFVRAGDERS